MNTNTALIPFSRYVRLYTLHQVERPAELWVLRVRVETLRYSFAPLQAGPLDAAYASDPREGVALVQQVVLPRLQTLLDSDDPWAALGAGQDEVWRRYASARGLPPARVPIPAIQPPPLRPAIAPRSRVTARLARVQQALEVIQTAAETAQALAALWQNWQIGRERLRLLDAQRTLLQDAVRAQLAGQSQALSGALNHDFVRGYLLDHGTDAGADALFDTGPDEPTGEDMDAATRDNAGER